MLEPVILAPIAQVEKIASTSELTSTSTVVAFKDATAVMRNAFELDPVDFGTLSYKERAIFIWSLENTMRINGVKSYYYNVPTDAPEEWKEMIKHWGGEAVSPSPEIRYRKVL